MAKVTLQRLARHLGGELVGDGELVVEQAAGLEEAGPGAITFFTVPQHTTHFVQRYQRLLAATRATAAIVPREVKEAPCALIRVDNPDLAFARAVELLYPAEPLPAPGISPAATVSPQARVADGVRIGPGVVVAPAAEIGERTAIFANAYIGPGVRVGEDCRLFPGVVLYHGVRLGDRVRVHANAVIGSDGFGYAWDGRRHTKIPQVGTVEIGDDVEIGACTTIDRARMGTTVIGPGAKLDNLVQIAHNVKIGAHCAFAAQVGISGSAEFGNGCLMGGQAGAAGHIKVGDGAIFSARAGVSKDLPGAAHYTGYPARAHHLQLDEWRNLKAMPRVRAAVRELERRMAELEKRLHAGE